MQETSKNEICLNTLPTLTWRLSCTKMVSLPTLLVLCRFELPSKKFGGMLLIPVVQRETWELCKEGECACCSLDFFLLSRSTLSLFAQIGFLERGLKKGRQPVELPWECVNSSSRAGAGGGMVLKPLKPFILYKRTKGEMRSQAQFTGELFPKIIWACSKIWLGIPSFLQLMDELRVLQLLLRYPCWAFICGHDEVTC